jgi:NAD(P)H-dependent FMN reductase
MKFTIVSGSNRQQSQSAKVANFLANYLSDKLNQDASVLDLAKENFRYWDETFWSDFANFDKNWLEARKGIIDSDGLVIIAPEWNGMIPPVLLNFFHLAVKGELANKPALIVGVSSEINGAYPVSILRINSYKNSFLCYIPQHLIVRHVESVLNTLECHENQEDESIRERIDYSLKVLVEYAKGFQLIRRSDIIIENKYKYGM